MSFDLAGWLTGTAAADAALEDCDESSPPNDYYNDTDRVRAMPVDPLAEVAWLPEAGNPETLEIVGYETWRSSQSTRSFRPGDWMEVKGGVVVSIEEQFVP
jgi:hypothetical protein